MSDGRCQLQVHKGNRNIYFSSQTSNTFLGSCISPKRRDTGPNIRWREHRYREMFLKPLRVASWVLLSGALQCNQSSGLPVLYIWSAWGRKSKKVLYKLSIVYELQMQNKSSKEKYYFYAVSCLELSEGRRDFEKKVLGKPSTPLQTVCTCRNSKREQKGTKTPAEQHQWSETPAW